MHINGREKVGFQNLRNPKAFIDYSQTIDDVYEILEDCTSKKILLVVFDDMIEDVKSNKKLTPKATELFLRVRKLNIAFVFISESYLKVRETIRLIATHSLASRKVSEYEVLTGKNVLLEKDLLEKLDK